MARFLRAYLQKTIRDPFVWGTCDCALWAAGAVLDIAGFDPAADYRGEYSTARGFLAILKAQGGLLSVAEHGLAAMPTGERENGVAVAQVGRRCLCGLLIEGQFWAKFDGGAGTIWNAKILEGWNLWAERLA